MQFLIADTFTDSLGRLTTEEQKAAKNTAFDLQVDPRGPGLQWHRLEHAKDKNFWSARVDRDIRIIVHRTDSSSVLCYTDHHEKSYAWAERRKLETHPATGAAQFVEIRETVKEITKVIEKFIEKPAPKPPLFADVSSEDLLRYGVPPEWLADVRVANEDTLDEIAKHLPNEASEALLQLAVGEKPVIRKPLTAGGDAFSHPDAQRRFRVMGSQEELQRALEYPWDKWTVFLHPAQREWIERDYAGPARVSGSAGTGKTIVALHRAVFLARHNPDARVLLTTFSDTLANALRARLRRLVSNEPRITERLEVDSIDVIGQRLSKPHQGQLQFATPEIVAEVLTKAAFQVTGHDFDAPFLLAEWEEIVDAQQLYSWEAYRDAKRLGRKLRLPEKQRTVLWSIFSAAIQQLAARNVITIPGMFGKLTAIVAKSKSPPFDFAVVDEAQDISLAQLRFLAALGGNRPNSLFFAGDTGQRIFQQPFSWKSIGVDVRGRSRTLNVNYRTTHQIRSQADRLLAAEVSDSDGIAERRDRTISVFNGTPPTIQVCPNRDAETAAVAGWLKQLVLDGVRWDEIGVFVRSETEIERALAAVNAAKFPVKVLDEHAETTGGFVSVGTMHLAKGLEFRAVAVMASDDEIIPSQKRIEGITDQSDLEEVYNTERHLLYVACTRARDHLLVTGVTPGSEFLADMKADAPTSARGAKTNA